MEKLKSTSLYTFRVCSWSVASVGTLRVYGRARCTRCIVTTTDQETARQEGAKGEPLSTLREYRKSKGGKVCLGIVSCEDLLSGDALRNIQVVVRTSAENGSPESEIKQTPNCHTCGGSSNCAPPR